jgi:hypothetical protein
MTCLGALRFGADSFERGTALAGNSKRGRAIRKVKQPIKLKTAKAGTDAAKIDRQAKLPPSKHSK